MVRVKGNILFIITNINVVSPSERWKTSSASQ